jgi:hypothetical protein
MKGTYELLKKPAGAATPTGQTFQSTQPQINYVST